MVACAVRIDLARMRLVAGRYEVPLDDGSRAVLTLDPGIQRRAEQVLAQAKAPYGAVVVMAVDGRLLALAGRSTAEPGLGAELDMDGVEKHRWRAGDPR